jgi:molybdate transport system substrate-binding protein
MRWRSSKKPARPSRVRERNSRTPRWHGGKKGADVPDISSEAALRKTLLQASSIAYSDSASGRYVSQTLFKKLGIEKEVADKATMVERIPVASEVAKGKYAVGFQQVSELLPVQGVTFIGKIPDNLQYITRFAGAVTRHAEHPAEGKRC